MSDTAMGAPEPPRRSGGGLWAVVVIVALAFIAGAWVWGDRQGYWGTHTSYRQPTVSTTGSAPAEHTPPAATPAVPAPGASEK